MFIYYRSRESCFASIITDTCRVMQESREESARQSRPVAPVILNTCYSSSTTPTIHYFLQLYC